MKITASFNDKSITTFNDKEIIPLIELILSLGYPTAAAFRQAMHRGQLPIEVFSIPNRRGKFAFRADYICWLNSLNTSDCAKKGGTD
jgi:hypothetical protein